MRDIELFVPGRLCLFGEHSDWAGGHRRTNPLLEKGYTLVAGTDQGITARVRPHPDSFIISAVLPDGGRAGPYVYPWKEKDLALAARSGGFASYAAGAASVMRGRYGTGGVEIECFMMDLPMKKGLSSSAAVCVIVARGIGRLYGLGLSVEEEMEAAYEGEVLSGSACGRMDQACAFGRVPVFMTFSGDDVVSEPLRPGGKIDILIVDLDAEKNTMRILAALNACFPDTEGKIAADVRRALGPVNADILARARRAVEEGDGEGVGRLMEEAQAVFDERIAPACPDELAAPVLHRVLAYTGIEDLVWGGKGVGSQGDGCAQFVVRGEEESGRLATILREKEGMPSFPLSIQPGK